MMMPKTNGEANPTAKPIIVSAKTACSPTGEGTEHRVPDQFASRPDDEESEAEEEAPLRQSRVVGPL